MKFIDETPLTMVLLACATLGLAPYVPQPHVMEKLGMLFAGTLTRPVDIFDLLMHGAPWLFLVAKLLRMAAADGGNDDA